MVLVLWVLVDSHDKKYQKDSKGYKKEKSNKSYKRYAIDS